MAVATHSPYHGYLGLAGEPGPLRPPGRQPEGVTELGREGEGGGNQIPQSWLLRENAWETWGAVGVRTAGARTVGG